MLSTDDLLSEKEYIIQRVLHIHYMPRHICAKYRIELDDLMQVGRIALWEASLKFKPKKNGTSFDTYAHRNINFRLLDYLKYLNRPIRHLDYCPSIHSEIDEDRELLDVIPGEADVVEETMETIFLKGIQENLTKQEKEFLNLRLEGYSYTEIEKDLKVKRVESSNIRLNLKEKIKNHQQQLVI